MAKKVIFFGKNFADIKLRLNFASKYHSLWAIKQKSITNLNSTIMKKIFTLALVAVASLAAINVNAQTTGTRVDGDNGMWSNIYGDPSVTISAVVGNTDDLKNVPLTIYLSNPDTAMCAFEAYIKGITPSLFVYDEDEEMYTVTRGSRLRAKHNIITMAHTARYGDDAFYVSITGEGNPTFRGTEGALVTLYFDASGLSDGQNTIQLVDAFGVTNDKVATGSHTTSWYFSTDQIAAGANNVVFTKADGKVTGIATATAEDVANAKSIYTINGTKVTAPQKGQIYVIDGKVVKY